MENPTLALIASFVAMLLIASSYFFKKKELYLLFQAIGMVFLGLNYFFTLEFFAMLGVAVGLFRALIFFFYEKKNKLAPIFWAYLCAGLTLAAYFIVNWNSLKPLDIIYMVSLILYAFIFLIRDLKLMRFTVLAPNFLAVLYNVLLKATPFAVLTYAFELVANLVSILKYHVFGKEEKEKKPQTIEKESTYEEN